mgnify:CR=1 FL=1
MKRPDLKLAGIERGAPLTGPETIHIDITNGCNTNCVTCWDHSPYLTLGRSGAWKRQRVEVAQVREILDEAADLGGHRAVILSGMGEPFTHPDVYAMIEEVKRRGLHLTLRLVDAALDGPGCLCFAGRATAGWEVWPVCGAGQYGLAVGAF